MFNFLITDSTVFPTLFDGKIYLLYLIFVCTLYGLGTAYKVPERLASDIIRI